MSKVAIYVRESRDDNGISYETIEIQKSMLEKYIKDKNLGELYTIFEDDNYSGVNFERPGIKQLLEDASNGKFDILVAKDLSRLGRSNARTLLFLESVEENGVRVITYDGRYDSLRDAETVGIDSWFNERYVIDISKKIRANLRHKIEKGEYIGNAPFGYVKSKEKHNRLEICKEEARTVKLIYQKYLQGYGYKKIASLLNEQRVSSKMWNASMIKRILTSRVYIGDTIQGVSEKVSYKSKKTRKLPESSWIVTNNTHQPIITEDMYLKVQEIRKKRIKGSQNNKGQINVFKGILICATCLKTMYSRKQDDKQGYTCSTYEKLGSKICKRHYVKEEYLLDIVFHDMHRMISDYLNEYPKLEKYMCKIDVGVKSRLNELNDFIESIIHKQTILYYDRLDERITASVYDSINRELQTNLTRLEEEQNKLHTIEINRDNTGEVLLQYIQSYKSMKSDMQRRFVLAAVDKITVDDDEICIYYTM